MLNALLNIPLSHPGLSTNKVFLKVKLFFSSGWLIVTLDSV